MTNGNDCAHPTYLPGTPGMIAPVEEMGLTKRELFAAMAMQGFCAQGPVSQLVMDMQFSVEIADALIAALNKGAHP